VQYFWEQADSAAAGTTRTDGGHRRAPSGCRSAAQVRLLYGVASVPGAAHYRPIFPTMAGAVRVGAVVMRQHCRPYVSIPYLAPESWPLRFSPRSF